MKTSPSRRGLLLAAIAGACLFPATSDAMISVGSGPDVSHFSLESPHLGVREYEIRYTYNATAPKDAYFLLNQIIAADSSISVELVNYGSAADPNIIVDSITYGGVTETNETVDPYTPYWAHWASGGKTGYPTAAPISSDTWTIGSGISSPYRFISPGSRDALIFSDGITEPTTTLYAPPDADAISSTDPRFTIWASDAVVHRGPVDIEAPDDALATYGNEAAATGPADATVDEPFPVVSLGDGGSADLTFATPFGDIPGPDFAVFENSFNTTFLELAHVEVSSDGVHFYRFPSRSLTPASESVAVDPSDIHNLAGKYPAGYGTPFDLAELRSLYRELDTQRITHVRVVDVVGTSAAAQGSFDAAGNIIIDPFPTPFPSGGFDLDAVGAFNPTTTSYSAWTTSQGLSGASATPTADPDQNGVPNLIEYLTGDGIVTVGDHTLQFSRLAYRSGGNLKLLASADLQNWTTLAESNNAAPMSVTEPSDATLTESGDFRKVVRVQIRATSAYRYFRLAADLTP